MTVNQFQVDPSSGHPADVAIERERTGSPSTGSYLTPQELASMSQLDPANLVAELANNHEPVPRDSPLHKLSGDQLRNEMQKSMRAIQDFRSVQSSLGSMQGKRALAEQDPTNEHVRSMLGTPMFDSNGNIRIEGSEFQKAEQAAEKSRYSATLAGFRDAEYNQAVEQLESTNPNARPSATPSGAPYEITRGADGSYDVLIDTGEHFKGANADEIIQKLTHSKRKTGLWGRDLSAQLKQLQASPQSSQPPQLPTPQSDPTLPAANLGALPDESTMWLLNNVAKVAGFPDANAYLSYQQQRDQRLQELESKFETFDSRMIAEDFAARHPEFPGDQHSADILDGLITRSGLAPNVENLSLMHTYAVQAHMYEPLRPDEIAAANGQAQQSSNRTPPPQPPPANNPDGTQWQGDPWRMSQDELRRKVLDGGGLGKALLEMRAGETFGG